VQTTGENNGVRVMSFETQDGGFVAELMNSLNFDSAANLVFQGRTLHLTLPARSISTALW
jgi:O-glycosyl hydrolase